MKPFSWPNLVLTVGAGTHNGQEGEGLLPVIQDTRVHGASPMLHAG